MKFYYTYVLRSLKDCKFYYGFTENLKLRIEQHNNGQVKSTKHRVPLEIIYFEGCLSKKDALRREKYLKTYYGTMFIKKRLSTSLTELNSYSTDRVNNDSNMNKLDAKK